MKRILLALMLGIGVLGFAQNSEEKLEKMMKKQIVDKIKNYKPTDLVPYSKDGKEWALMNVKSRKILTDFVLRSPRTFNPEAHPLEQQRLQHADARHGQEQQHQPALHALK